MLAALKEPVKNNLIKFLSENGFDQNELNMVEDVIVNLPYDVAFMIKMIKEKMQDTFDDKYRWDDTDYLIAHNNIGSFPGGKTTNFDLILMIIKDFSILDFTYPKLSILLNYIGNNGLNATKFIQGLCDWVMFVNSHQEQIITIPLIGKIEIKY